MLTKCVKCRFNIRQTDEFCPNCGLQNPSKENPQLSGYNIPLLMASIGLFSLIIFLIIQSLILSKPMSIESFFIVAVLSLSFSFIPSAVFYNLVIKKINEVKVRKRKVYNANFLIQKENIVSQRIADLVQRGSGINQILEKIGNSQTQNLQEISQKLLSAQEIINNQFVRYELQKRKIELVRMQNKMLPYLENLEKLKDFQTENGILESENIIREIGEINQKLSKKFPASFREERQNFLHQLQETSISCGALREVLLSKQALRALQSVQPIETIDNSNHTNEFSHTIETFNIQTTLTDFSESFEQLENEYRRLLADKEVSEKLLNYEN